MGIKITARTRFLFLSLTALTSHSVAASATCNMEWIGGAGVWSNAAQWTAPTCASTGVRVDVPGSDVTIATSQFVATNEVVLAGGSIELLLPYGSRPILLRPPAALMPHPNTPIPDTHPRHPNSNLNLN